VWAAGGPNALQQKITRDTLELQAAEADRLSTTDLLTGLANRRMLEHRLAEMLASYGTESQAAVFIIDVDHFKQVNDAEGHLIGDVVLRILASRLRSAVDYPRLLVRWGGEEFVVLAPQIAGGTAVAELGENLCARVNATPFAIDQGRVLGITVSVGGSSGRLGAFNSLLAIADDALYAAKRGGRNRAIIRVA
jgi:two-component system cell cycle response regulator